MIPRQTKTEMENMGAESVTCVISDNYAAGEECAEGAYRSAGRREQESRFWKEQQAHKRLRNAKADFERNGGKDGSGIEIVASQPANYNRNEGYTVFQSILPAHIRILPDYFAANDEGWRWARSARLKKGA